EQQVLKSRVLGRQRDRLAVPPYVQYPLQLSGLHALGPDDRRGGGGGQEFDQRLGRSRLACAGSHGGRENRLDFESRRKRARELGALDADELADLAESELRLALGDRGGSGDARQQFRLRLHLVGNAQALEYLAYFRARR